jgi:Zn-dependent protease
VASPDGAAVVAQIVAGYSNMVDGQSVITPIALLLYYFLYINVLLAVFNMIPVPPLDGGRIVGQLIPASWQPAYAVLSRYGFVVLIVLLFLRVPFYLFNPVMHFFLSILK